MSGDEPIGRGQYTYGIQVLGSHGHHARTAPEPRHRRRVLLADDLRDRPCMKINASHDDVDRAAYYRTRSQLGTFHLYFGSQWWIQYSIRWHHDAPDDLPLLRVPLQADRHGRARGSANMRETMWLRFSVVRTPSAAYRAASDRALAYSSTMVCTASQ